MIIVGATGNLLVILVVIRNRAMRTARNVFIVNLAISDLMLCLITMPLTLVEILYMTWQVRYTRFNTTTRRLGPLKTIR
jgi:neuropeptide Y receptor